MNTQAFCGCLPASLLAALQLAAACDGAQITDRTSDAFDALWEAGLVDYIGGPFNDFAFPTEEGFALLGAS